MFMFVSFLLVSLAALVSIPPSLLFIEIVASLFLPLRRTLQTEPRTAARIAIVIPAHNEGTGIHATVLDIKRQLPPDSRLIVVADNCTDDTAAIATGAGAEVIQRQEISRIGKGYALDFAFKHLRQSPPDVVIVIDAAAASSYDTPSGIFTTFTSGKWVYSQYPPHNGPV